jgi:hypothetical protein
VSGERATSRALLFSIVAAGALARMITCFFDGPLHPDEYFQYLEPAWWHISGVGLQTWEWNSGIRSWVLPLYHGGWLVLLRALGVADGAPLVWLLKLHWALINSAAVVLAYRAGALIARRLEVGRGKDPGAGDAGGVLAALLVAAFPLLVIYSSHTLSELPSMLCLFAGLVLTAECVEARGSARERYHEARERHDERGGQPNRPLTHRAVLIGALLSLGACLRIANAPMVLLPALWLLILQPHSGLWLLLGAALPATFFALVDLVTWGKFAGSFVGYLKFNLFEGKAASVFGSEPPLYYFKLIWGRLPWTLAPLTAAALFGLRASWPFALSALLALGYLSLQGHKEERFIILVWPLLLCASGGVLGSVLQQLLRARRPASSGVSPRTRRAVTLALCALVCSAVLVDGLRHVGERTWRVQARIDAQRWVAKQSAFTGLLMDYPLDGAGALWLGKSVPHLAYARELLANPVFSHVLVAGGSQSEREARGAGFTRVHEDESIVVLARVLR